MKFLKYLLPILILIFTNSQAYITGNDLLENCNIAVNVVDNDWRTTDIYNAPDQYVRTGACFGFVQASADLLANDFCVPQDVTYSQLVRIVLKYLKNNPDKLNLAAFYLTYTAIKETYTCKPAPAPGIIERIKKAWN